MHIFAFYARVYYRVAFICATMRGGHVDVAQRAVPPLRSSFATAMPCMALFSASDAMPRHYAMQF